MLRFEGVGKTWPDGTVAMDGVTLEVPARQFCVILGSSGAGKSTLLNMVNGMVTPTVGRVYLGDLPVERRTMRVIRRQVATIHQQFDLVGRLSVLSNILTGTLSRTGLFRSLLGLFPYREKRNACQWVQRVGLGEEHLRRRAADLSGGQQQRVAIARAYLSQPRVLLADEPVASLDPKTSEEVLRLIKETAENENTTVLCSLHQVELARRFADRVIAMKDGLVFFDGTPEELTNQRLIDIYGEAGLEQNGEVQAGREANALCNTDAPSGGKTNGNGLSRMDASQWKLPTAYRLRTLFGLLLMLSLLVFSAHRTEIGKAINRTVDAVASGIGGLIGIEHQSKTASGLARLADKAFPPVIQREQSIDLMGRKFDKKTDLPWFSRLEVREIRNDAGQVIGTKEYVVEPVGYLLFVIALMLKTIEIAIWGTLLAIAISVPLAYFGASNFTPHWTVYWIARGLCSLSRSMHELILALILVVMYGIGPIAGVLALGLHCAGFLGKFFADDMENAPRGPQTALRAAGASKLQVIRYAVLPQILPQVFAYIQYILERNIRSATVLGIVGAGGIGLELIGQWNLYHYAHVTTIVLVIFATVLLLEVFTQRLRSRII